MKYKKFKKLPLKQKITMLVFWNSIIFATINFYAYLGAKVIEKLLK